MNREQRTIKHDEGISEGEAHRLLARAVELDAHQRAAVSVADLQQAAHAAGIAPEAFAQALTELKAGLLEPETVGQQLVARLVGFRRAACLTAFSISALATPGDTVILTLISGLGLYGAYEGLIALSRLLGKASPPQGPPRRQELERHVGAPERNDSSRHGSRTQFMLVPRPAVLGPDPAVG